MKMTAHFASAFAAIFAGVVLTLAGSGPVAAKEPGWPCIQRKVPKLTVGAFWSGPPIDENANWRDDREVSALVARIISRRVPLEEAEKEIAAFASAHPNDKTGKLTLLFAGTFTEINNLRSDILRGIDRFMKNQQAKTVQLQQARDEFDALRAKPDKTPDDLRRLDDLQTTVLWLQRIYDDREGSLTYVCESPVLLEQRLFALSRAIQSHLG
jgi:hypothetical protein